MTKERLDEIAANIALDELGKSTARAVEALMIDAGVRIAEENAVAENLALLDSLQPGDRVELSDATYSLVEGYDGTVVTDGLRFLPLAALMPLFRAAIRVGAKVQRGGG